MTRDTAADAVGRAAWVARAHNDLRCPVLAKLLFLPIRAVVARVFAQLAALPRADANPDALGLKRFIDPC